MAGISDFDTAIFYLLQTSALIPRKAKAELPNLQLPNRRLIS